MKRLLFLIMLLSAVIPVQAGEWFKLPPAKYETGIILNTRLITDRYDNELWLHRWTEFNDREPFHHPNGYDYPGTGQGLVWIYTEPKHYKPVLGITNWAGALTLTGLTTASIIVWQRQHTFNGWQDWNTVGTYFGIVGTSLLTGLILDQLAKPKGPPEYQYRFYSRR